MLKDLTDIKNTIIFFEYNFKVTYPFKVYYKKYSPFFTDKL